MQQKQQQNRDCCREFSSTLWSVDPSQSLLLLLLLIRLMQVQQQQQQQQQQERYS